MLSDAHHRDVRHRGSQAARSSSHRFHNAAGRCLASQHVTNSRNLGCLGRCRQRISTAVEGGATRKELDRIGRQITRLVDAIADDARALKSKLKDLEAEQARLTEELDGEDRPQPLAQSTSMVCTIHAVRTIACCLV